MPAAWSIASTYISKHYYTEKLGWPEPNTPSLTPKWCRIGFQYGSSFFYFMNRKRDMNTHYTIIQPHQKSQMANRKFSLYLTNILPQIDFSINKLSTETRLRSQRSPAPYKINVNNCKLLIDLVIRIELNRAILVPRFSNSLRNRMSHFIACFYIWKHVSWESRFRCYAGY